MSSLPTDRPYEPVIAISTQIENLVNDQITSMSPKVIRPYPKVDRNTTRNSKRKRTTAILTESIVSREAEVTSNLSNEPTYSRSVDVSADCSQIDDFLKQFRLFSVNY